MENIIEMLPAICIGIFFLIGIIELIRRIAVYILKPIFIILFYFPKHVSCGHPRNTESKTLNLYYGHVESSSTIYDPRPSSDDPDYNRHTGNPVRTTKSIFRLEGKVKVEICDECIRNRINHHITQKKVEFSKSSTELRDLLSMTSPDNPISTALTIFMFIFFGCGGLLLFLQSASILKTIQDFSIFKFAFGAILISVLLAAIGYIFELVSASFQTVKTKMQTQSFSYNKNKIALEIASEIVSKKIGRFALPKIHSWRWSTSETLSDEEIREEISRGNKSLL